VKLRNADPNASTAWQWFNSQNMGYSVSDDYDSAAHRSNDARGYWIPDGDENWEFRPEEIESIFYGHRVTGDPRWADYNWDIFQAFQKTAKTSQAYATVNNVDMPYGGSMSDYADSFLYAEVLKYFYLTFSDPSVIDLKTWVLNTEAHPFLVQCADNYKN
jgi:mannosyl-oligosaccharide alpha-1,2-mannosidase